MKNQTRIFSILLFLILWQASSIAIGSELFPSVIDVVKNLSQQIENKEIFTHLFITLYRVFVSFFITMFIGIA